MTIKEEVQSLKNIYAIDKRLDDPFLLENGLASKEAIDQFNAELGSKAKVAVNDNGEDYATMSKCIPALSHTY